MTVNNVTGFVRTSDGRFHQIFQGVTDGTPEALTIYDLAGSDRNIYDHLYGKIITKIALQVDDGGILDYVQVTQNGEETHYWEAGERIANSPEVYNLEVNVTIPVLKTTRINIDTAD